MNPAERARDDQARAAAMQATRAMLAVDRAMPGTSGPLPEPVQQQLVDKLTAALLCGQTRGCAHATSPLPLIWNTARPQLLGCAVCTRDVLARDRAAGRSSPDRCVMCGTGVGVTAATFKAATPAATVVFVAVLCPRHRR